MANKLLDKKNNFGTMPVLLTAISTILGAILFLRFGYAVGHVGFYGVVGIILLGHLVSIPTAFAVAEIATNQKVMGGGAYYIISRSFGLKIGAAIGITLYLSQAISVAFYIIAFAEAFDPVINYLRDNYDILIYDDKRLISLPTMALLSFLVLYKGANIGMKALYFVVALLFISLIMFLAGSSHNAEFNYDLSARISNPDNFFLVFTIIFPAFTGLAAGLGLSGDLKNPKKSIPAGTIWATVLGMFIYIIVAYKLAISFSPDELAGDQLIMQKIAIWGPIIPIGLASASLSSALGSIMVAPRTLQAIGLDNIFPNFNINKWFAKGTASTNEPNNSSIITIVIAFFFIALGDIDSVAKIIAMFFMFTYGAICLISFLEHFAADPSYRPTFRSRWYISLLGAILSFWLMFKMNFTYALVALIIMVLIYFYISSSSKEKKGFANLFRGVIFQLSRQLQVFVQRADKEDMESSWRPFVICISQDSFKRRSAFDLLRWISYKYGFGTYIHFIKGFLNEETSKESVDVLQRLIHLAAGSKNRVYLDTIISPSYTSAIAQVIQLQGISGRGNNMILFEYNRQEPESLNEALNNYALLASTNFDVCFLSTSFKGFGYRKEINIWINFEDYENANLMILIAYIVMGHPDWRKGFIKIIAATPGKHIQRSKSELLNTIKSGRLPISTENVEIIPIDENRDIKQAISEKSVDADLTIVGFNDDDLSIDKFNGYSNDLSNIVFVHSFQAKKIN
jgi:amino acid transporter